MVSASVHRLSSCTRPTPCDQEAWGAHTASHARTDLWSIPRPYVARVPIGATRERVDAARQGSVRRHDAVAVCGPSLRNDADARPLPVAERDGRGSATGPPRRRDRRLAGLDAREGASPTRIGEEIQRCTPPATSKTAASWSVSRALGRGRSSSSVTSTASVAPNGAAGGRGTSGRNAHPAGIGWRGATGPPPRSPPARGRWRPLVVVARGGPRSEAC
jgi:hypothetical protein